jgi:hypothetical protein
MDSQQPPLIPNQLDHIAMISRINRRNRQESEPLLKKHEGELRLFGVALNAIYQAATCHRKCWGPPHVLEMIGARIYNLACAAYSLISIGYYDEAMNLTRGIGEAGNLVALSVKDKVKFNEWLQGSKQERLRNFSPVKVRTMIGASDPFLMMDDTQYGELSEAYTHITPRMAPNRHNEFQRMVAGGIVQEAGMAKALEQLVYLVGTIALFYCQYFKFDDLYHEITDLTRSPHSRPPSDAVPT